MNIVMGAEIMTSTSPEGRDAQFKRYIKLERLKEMLGKWEGFTEDDLKAMSRANGAKSMNAARNQRSAVTQKPKEGKIRTSTDSNNQAQPEVSDASCLSDAVRTSEDMNAKSTEITEHMPEPKEENPNVSTVCLKIKGDTAYEVLRNEFESKNESLSDFHSRQRMMEEQNRKKKELLAQALAERKKRTHAEAHRLQKIHEELQRLDNLLSSDVSILRDQIEAASLEYSVAQKRFGRAEREYLDAKLILMSKLERKELLTAHLCTIIEQNEMRKAQKLSELMEKLQLTASDI